MADTDVTGRIGIELDNTKAAEGAKKLEKVIADMEKKVDQQLAGIEKGVQQIGTALDTTSKKAKTAGDQLASASKKAGSGVLTQVAQQSRQLTVEADKRITLQKRKEGDIEVVQERGKQQRLTDNMRIGGKQRLDLFRTQQRELNRIQREADRQAEFSAKQASPWYSLGWQAKAGKVPASQLLTQQLNQSLAASNLQYMMGQQAIQQMRTGAGLSPSQTWQQQMNQAVARSNAANAAFFAQQQGGGGAAAGGGRGGFWRGGGWQRIIGGGAGGFAAGVLGGLGVGVGGYAVARAGTAVIEASKTAVAYERQSVAAVKLAGSQERLNALIDKYVEASGGAVDKSFALEKVTRLLATGFASSEKDIERFVRATRGASIALTKPQEYVIQETQLAISNTSVKRLDQIGLGIKEVQERIADLRAENKSWTREVAFQQAVLGLMEEKYGALTETVEGQKTGVERLTASWSNFMLALGQGAKGPVNAMSRALSALLDLMSDANPSEGRKATLREIESQKRTVQIANDRFADALRLPEIWGALTGRTGLQVRAQRALNEGTFRRSQSSGYIGGPEDYGIAPERPRFREDQMDVLSRYYNEFNKLEREYATSRLNQIRQYEEQRADIIRNYSKQVAREEEDFQRQRARSQRDYERSIVDLMRDAAERDAELLDDYNDRLEDMQEDHAKRVEDIEENYREDRERAEKEHRDRLLSAAGQLDAIAVLEERKRWKRENEEREKGHKKALEDQRENLQKQIDEAKEAYEERLEDARKADARRLEDMAADRARQLADEEEDRAIRNARAAEDYQDQLDELDRQHQLTLQRLADEAEDNRQALADAMAADLAEVDIYVEGYLEKMAKRDKAIEEWFDKMIGKMEDVIEQEQKPAGPPPFAWPKITGFQSGGPVPFTGLAMLHAGEYVLPASASVSNSSASYNNRNVVFESGAIQVQTVPGSEYMVADLVEERLVALLGAI